MTHRMRLLQPGLLVLVILAGCVGPGATRVRPQAQRDLLTRTEILSSPAEQGNLFDAIQSLRPNFFVTPRGVNSRGSSASLPLAVYVDRMRQAGVESLRSIAAFKVAEVKFLEPTASQNLYGPSASGGAIIVTMYVPKEPDGAAWLGSHP